MMWIDFYYHILWQICLALVKFSIFWSFFESSFFGRWVDYLSCGINSFYFYYNIFAYHICMVVVLFRWLCRNWYIFGINYLSDTYFVFPVLNSVFLLWTIYKRVLQKNKIQIESVGGEMGYRVKKEDTKYSAFILLWRYINRVGFNVWKKDLIHF